MFHKRNKRRKYHMYTLEYTTNKGIMNLFGPRMGRSLFSDRNVEIKCRFQLQVRDNRFIFDNGSGNRFCITPTHIQQSQEGLTLLTERSTYVFSVAA